MKNAFLFNVQAEKAIAFQASLLEIGQRE